MSNSIIKNSSIRSGLVLFTAGTLYCVLGKFKNISDCSWKVQVGAFGITALAKTIMDAICENHKDDSVRLINNAVTLGLIGVASRACQFKFSLLGRSSQAEGVVFSTLAIATGYFGFNRLLGSAEVPELPPFYGLNEVTLSPDEFRDRLFKNTLPPIPITVEGDLGLPVPQDRHLYEMPECPELQSLPERLTINGNLTLTKCTNLTELPTDIHVTRSILLLACRGLKKLPDNFQVNGLYLEDCPGLTELPKNLIINRSLTLEKCRNIKELPEDLIVGYGLHINQSEITRIPDNLRELAQIELDDCIELTELPENLKVSRFLAIRNCLSLDHLPNGLHVGGDLRIGIGNIDAWDAMTGEYFLPEEWRELYLGKVSEDGSRLAPERRVKRIHTLPENLFIGGDLHCKSLYSLPKGLHVGGELNIPGCSVKELPEDMFVGGSISLERSNLSRIPSWMTTLGPKANGEERYVSLTGTRISQEDIDRLKSLQLPGVRFIVDDYVMPEDLFARINPYRQPIIQQNLLTLELISDNRPTKEDVKKAYKRLAVRHHPDKSNDDGEKFRKINEAYQMLMQSEIDEG